MVKDGQFLMELVRADDKTQKFLEHIGPLPDREHYIEVEPDVEYFIRIRADTRNHTLVTLSVDGEDLGYQRVYSSSMVEDSETQFNGIWTRSSGIQTMTALRFHRTMIRRPIDANTNAQPQMWTGNVTAYFYEAIADGTGYTQRDFKSKWNAQGKVGATLGINTLAEKKGVMSSKGESKLKKEIVSRQFMKSRKGRKLCTISAKYCCTPGLIANGILPRYVQNAANNSNVGRRQRRKTGESSHLHVDLT